MLFSWVESDSRSSSIGVRLQSSSIGKVSSDLSWGELCCVLQGTGVRSAAVLRCCAFVLLCAVCALLGACAVLPSLGSVAVCCA